MKNVKKTKPTDFCGHEEILRKTEKEDYLKDAKN